MFWGLIMEPNRRYSQTVKRSFHVSMAALDENTSDVNPTQVICQFDDRNYLLCTLIKGKISQVALDLNFEVGDKISFAMNGKGHVHLTGFIVDEIYESGDDESSEAEEGEILETIKSKNKKKKSQTAAVDSPPKKKLKSTLEMLGEISSNDSDDSDDSDVNMSDLMHSLDTTGFEDETEEPDDEDEAIEEEEDDNTDESDEDDEAEADGNESDSESSLSDDEELQNAAKVLENGSGGRKTRNQYSKHLEMQSKSDKQTKGDRTPAKTEKAQQKSAKTPTKAESTPTKSNKTPVVKGEKTPSKGEKTPKTLTKTPEQSPKAGSQMKKVEGGVILIDEVVGRGPVAKPGKLVSVHYEGRLKSNKQPFDKSNRNGNGFQFRIGKQEVIKGWDVGISGMRVGGKRRLIIPPAMAYGAKGSMPVIPPNSTLYFEVELLNVKT